MVVYADNLEQILFRSKTPRHGILYVIIKHKTPPGLKMVNGVVYYFENDESMYYPMRNLRLLL
jgi:hypothetical protein